MLRGMMARFVTRSGTKEQQVPGWEKGVRGERH